MGCEEPQRVATRDLRLEICDVSSPSVDCDHKKP